MKINWKYEFEAEDIISKSDIIQKKLNNMYTDQSTYQQNDT